MSDIEKFKSKCSMCLKTIEPGKDSYALIGVFKDNSVDYDPVRKEYLKHYLDREYNLCIPCYQKVINLIGGKGGMNNTFIARPTEVVKIGEPLSNSDEINKVLERGKKKKEEAKNDL